MIMESGTEPEGMEIKIFFLGTSAGVPTKDRNVSSILILRKGEQIFFDFGEGTQKQVFKLGLGFRRKLKIFITHMHGDHIFGLPPLLQTLTLFRRQEPLYIYGPKPLKDFIDYLVTFLTIDPEYKIVFNVVAHNKIFDFGEYYVQSIKSDHDEYSVSYILKEYDRPGRFNRELAEHLNIPKKLWGPLSKGKNINWNGKEYKASDFFIPPPIKGRKIVYTGDTRPYEELINYAKNADVLIHEATYTNQYIERSIANKHSTAKEAAEIALKANVKILVLTHFSARYSDVNELLIEAREVFPATFIAEDLSYVEIPYVKPRTSK